MWKSCASSSVRLKIMTSKVCSGCISPMLNFIGQHHFLTEGQGAGCGQQVRHGAKRGQCCNQRRPSEGWIHALWPRATTKSWCFGTKEDAAPRERDSTARFWDCIS